jgi:hypothetical protein
MTPFCRGLKNIWSGAKNTKRSKKSQALRKRLFGNWKSSSVWKGFNSIKPRHRRFEKALVLRFAVVVGWVGFEGLKISLLAQLESI